MNSFFSVKNIHASVGEKKILHGVDMEVEAGEIHILMGPNGSGKSTFAAALMGSPHVKIESGTLLFSSEDITGLLPEERARKGMYLGFQYPAELPGVGIPTFLRSALASRGIALPPDAEFRAGLIHEAEKIGLPQVMLERNVNEGFSGGEKKRHEIFQLSILKPSFAILDEFDSGMDIDGIRAAAAALREFLTPERSLLIITHYGRIAEYLKPDKVHIMVSGKIAKSGGAELIEQVEGEGFEQFIA